MKRNKIFNAIGDDSIEQRSIVKGGTTGLFNLNSIKYTWAKNLYQVMIGNFWIPEKVKGLADDKAQFNMLSPMEKEAYKGILSFLIFLDSIQTVNLPNFNEHITAPEVNLILSIQAYQEAIHSQSYATLLESVVPSSIRDEIYYYWKDNEILLERNEYIGGIYQKFIDDPSDENFFRGIVANFILEGIYFYNGFAFFDTLASQGKMLATDRMIGYIRRDELTHVTIFANIIKEIKKEFPSMFNLITVKSMFRQACEQEIKWGKHILGNKIVGMSDDNIDRYTKWLVNNRLAMIGVEPLYGRVTDNPFKHLDIIQDSNSDRGNFFESTVTNYAQSSSLKGTWDF